MVLEEELDNALREDDLGNCISSDRLDKAREAYDRAVLCPSKLRNCELSGIFFHGAKNAILFGKKPPQRAP